MNDNISKILLHEDAIFRRIGEMAEQITADYRGKELTVIALMNGSVFFLADLLRRIPLPLQLDGWSVASYHGTESAGQLTFRQTTLADVRSRHVLVLDDILDTGVTLRTVCDHLAATSGAASIKTCVLLRKLHGAPYPIDADYVGFDIPNEFVVGYGLDYNERYRNLPYIGVLTEEAIKAG